MNSRSGLVAPFVLRTLFTSEKEWVAPGTCSYQTKGVRGGPNLVNQSELILDYRVSNESTTSLVE